MALQTKLNDLIEKMNNGAILDAFDQYYAEDVTMAENANAPVAGKAANRQRELDFLASVKDWHSLDVHATAVNETGADAGVAFIEYEFKFTNTDDQPVHYQQVAVQRWENGQIASERFYYDTGA